MNTSIRGVFELVSPLLDDASIDRLKVCGDSNDIASFFTVIYDMITNDQGVLRKSYDDIYWDLVNSLIQSLNLSSSDWVQSNPTKINKDSDSILKILNWISLNSSPREFLLIIQEVESSSFIDISFFTRLSLIQLIKNSLKRIDKEKRYSFLKSLLPSIISILHKDTSKQQQTPSSLQQLNLNQQDKQHEDDEEEDGERNGHNEDEEEEEESDNNVKIMGQESEQQFQQKNSDDDLSWEYPLQCIIDFISSFSSDLQISEMIGIERIKGKQQQQQQDEIILNDVEKQQHLFLSTIFKVLGEESIVNPPQPLQCRGLPLIVGVGELLQSLGVTWDYIMTTDQRYRQKQREYDLEELYFDQGLDEDDLIEDDDDQQEEQEEQDNEIQEINNNELEEEDEDEDEDEEETSEDLINYDLDLSYIGIGYYFYNLLLRPTNDVYRLPSPLSPVTLLMQNMVYVSSMLQHPSYRVAFKAIQIISFLQKRMKPSSLGIASEYLKGGLTSHGEDENRWMIDQVPAMIDPPYHFLQMLECSISFMVKCPVAKMRSYAFQTLTNLLFAMNASTRFHTLSYLISTCAFPSFTGLLIHMLKSQIDSIWSDSKATDDDCAYFLSPKVIELLQVPMHAGGNLLERMDSLMNALNLYRYLLIRDQKEQRTGVWARSKIMGVTDQFLDPLVSRLQQLSSQYKASAQGDQEALRQALKDVSKLGVDSMDREDIKQASQLVIHHIDMSIQVIDRIKELQSSLIIDD